MIFDIADLFKQDATLYGLIGTVLGGIGVELLRRWFAKSDKKLDDAAKIRSELWAELGQVREDVRRVQNELDEWKEKYFRLYETNAMLTRENIELRSVNTQLRHMIEQDGGNASSIVDPPRLEN